MPLMLDYTTFGLNRSSCFRLSLVFWH